MLTISPYHVCWLKKENRFLFPSAVCTMISRDASIPVRSALHNDLLSGIVSIDEKVSGCIPSYHNESLVVSGAENGEGEAK